MTNEEAIKTLDIMWKMLTSAYDEIADSFVLAYSIAVDSLKAQIDKDTNVPSNGDTIYRQDAIDVLDEFQESVENGTQCYAKARVEMCNIPSAQPEQDREFVKLTVRNSNGRPYYSIIYLEFDDNGVGHDFEGYSSYSLDVISDYLKRYFMPSAQPEPHYDEWCTDCKEYDHERHCCPRWNKVIKQTVEDLKGVDDRKWIPCVDGNEPKANAECWISTNAKYVRRAIYAPRANDQPNGFIVTVGSFGFYEYGKSAKAWMPYTQEPEPYKEGEQNESD